MKVVRDENRECEGSHPSKAVAARAFGEALRICRNRAAVSQEDLAEAADIDRTYPSLLERGLREPTLGVVIRLARALGVNPCVLVRMTLWRIQQRPRLGRFGPG